MITLTTLHETIVGIDPWELEDWIARRWVRPEETDAGYRFEPIDVARVRLIQTLRHELALGADVMPVVLLLLDQLHEARRALLAMDPANDQQ